MSWAIVINHVIVVVIESKVHRQQIRRLASAAAA
jgi:hypothetical protein